MMKPRRKQCLRLRIVRACIWCGTAHPSLHQNHRPPWPGRRSSCAEPCKGKGRMSLSQPVDTVVIRLQVDGPLSLTGSCPAGHTVQWTTGRDRDSAAMHTHSEHEVQHEHRRSRLACAGEALRCAAPHSRTEHTWLMCGAARSNHCGWPAARSCLT